MDFDLAITIRRPPEAVWPVLDDIQAHADAPGSPIPEMEKIPPGPVHVGTRWREVVRLLPGVTMTVWSEATAVESGRRLEEDFRGPWMTGHLAYELEPAPAGCVLHQRETLTPHGPLRLSPAAWAACCARGWSTGWRRFATWWRAGRPRAGETQVAGRLRAAADADRRRRDPA